MDDLHVILQKLQTAHHASRYPTKHVFWNSIAFEFIQGPRIHVFHTIVNTPEGTISDRAGVIDDQDLRLDEKGSVKINNFWRSRSVKDVKLHNDSVELRVIQFQANFLQVCERGQDPRIRTRTRTFIAIWTFVGLCRTLFTVP